MKLTEDIKPVTHMKTQASDLLCEVKESVMACEALRHATLLIQLTAQGEVDVQARRTLPQSEVFDRVRRRHTRRRLLRRT